MSDISVVGKPVAMGAEALIARTSSATMEFIDPHWLTALTRDDGAVIVRRSVKLTDGEADEWYPEVSKFLGTHDYTVVNSDAVPSSEMFGGKAIVTTYHPKAAA